MKAHYRTSTIATGLIMLVGCSTTSMVESIKVDSTKSSINSGILYSLPKQFVTVKYEKKQLNASETKAQLDKDIKASEEAEKKFKEKEIEEKAKIAQRDAVSADDPQAAQVLVKLEQEITALKAEKIVLLAKAKLAAEKVSSSSALHQIALSDNQISESVSISAESPIADGKATFAAQLKSGASYASNLNLKTVNGLLEGATGISEDKLPEIVVSLAGSISALAKSSTAYKTRLSFNNVKCTVGKDFAVTIDPDSQNDLDILQALAKDACIKIDVIQPKAIGARYTAIENSNSQKGLIYQTPGVYQFQVSKCLDENCINPTYLNNIKLSLVQGGELGIVGFDTSNFTKNTYTYSFSKGSLTSSAVDKPSELLGLVQIIPNSLKAIVSIPAEIIKLKVDYSSADKALLENRKSMVETQLLLDQKLAELEAYRSEQEADD